jgi:hypothetical protein
VTGDDKNATERTVVQGGFREVIEEFGVIQFGHVFHVLGGERGGWHGHTYTYMYMYVCVCVCM